MHSHLHIFQLIVSTNNHFPCSPSTIKPPTLYRYENVVQSIVILHDWHANYSQISLCMPSGMILYRLAHPLKWVEPREHGIGNQITREHTLKSTLMSCTNKLISLCFNHDFQQHIEEPSSQSCLSHHFVTRSLQYGTALNTNMTLPHFSGHLLLLQAELS